MKPFMILLMVISTLLAPAAALASEVHCAYHPLATCYGTGQISHMPDGRAFEKYHCSCGDNVYVPQ